VPRLEQFPGPATDIIRFGDLDPQGSVANGEQRAASSEWFLARLLAIRHTLLAIRHSLFALLGLPLRDTDAQPVERVGHLDLAGEA
jgi:hypothetical protein